MSNDDAVVVPTASGLVKGMKTTQGARFLGIPYAKPPVGELRFAAPQPPEPWQEPLEAYEYGPTAQRKPLSEMTIIPEPSIPGEGILNLNVFTPDVTGKRPVLVWIHGGGFVGGSAASPWYDGASFNRDGVVLVSVGYRLGVEGFLHLEGAPDNRGVLDWVAALEWVRDNIAAFGGDPAQVTIAGQSAGGGAVLTLLATPAAQGLFRAAISVSGAVMHEQDRAAGLRVAELFTRRTGVPATVEALRGLTDDELLALQDKLTAPGPDNVLPLTVAPFADGQVVPVPVRDALRSGAAGRVPLVLGFTRDEFSMIPMPDEHALPVLAGFGLVGERAEAFAAHYGPGRLLGQALTDGLFRSFGVDLADGRAEQGLPTWLYEFDWSSGEAGGFLPGDLALHCLDLPFAFDLLGAPGVAAVAGGNPPQALADAMHGAWVSFIRDLDPGRSWPRYTVEERATMIWDVEPQVRPDALGGVRELWGR
ncbi:carboxylesterase family protein [Nonomuraea sp. NPDC050310]|uniref:carboxylesterase/lipase family protein n=1 Tax=Nonomuraea sp. NPDC050310 TaxID=3154935 RepID=UPI0033CB4A72